MSGKIYQGNRLVAQTNDAPLGFEDKGIELESLAQYEQLEKDGNLQEDVNYYIKNGGDESTTPLSKIPGVQNFLAAKKRYSNTTSVENNNTKQFATFLHITDVHGDEPRFYKGMEIADFLGVTGVFMTGDMVENKGYEDDFTFVTDHLDDYSTPIYETIGNHDGFGLSENQKYIRFTELFKQKYGYSGVDGTNGNQWYKDLTSEKLRIISLQPYRYVSTTEWVPGNSPHYESDMATFLEYTLKNTPDGYGIIILMHGPEKSLARDYQHDIFKQPETFFWTTGSGYTMLTQIVDDYISRASRTFTHTNSLTDGSTFNASWDFTSVPANNGVEFIGWVTGHTHSDNIAYVPGTTNKQLMLNMACSGLEKETTYDINEYNDLAREKETDSEYLFNAYIIDRELKQVKVIRIGAHLTYDLIDRNYMLISYK